jgi:hypothetical protein
MRKAGRGALPGPSALRVPVRLIGPEQGPSAVPGIVTAISLTTRRS